MESIWNSFLLVAVTEMGDKTQLLAFVLASRFRKPWAVMGGIFVATVLNHLLAASLGGFLAGLVAPETLRWGLATSFIGFAFWILVPDEDEENGKVGRFGAFLTTVVAFFFAEMGDKTQLSTVALAARYQNVLWVTVGTTLGMMFSDGLAVAFGKRLTERIPLKWVRWIAAAIFVCFGLAIAFESTLRSVVY